MIRSSSLVWHIDASISLPSRHIAETVRIRVTECTGIAKLSSIKSGKMEKSGFADNLRVRISRIYRIIQATMWVIRNASKRLVVLQKIVPASGAF